MEYAKQTAGKIASINFRVLNLHVGKYFYIRLNFNVLSVEKRPGIKFDDSIIVFGDKFFMFLFAHSPKKSVNKLRIKSFNQQMSRNIKAGINLQVS